MNLGLAFRLAFREIRHNGRFSAAFTLNLALGLSGFVLLSLFHGAVLDSFSARSRSLLTADLAVSARRNLTAEELSRADEAIARRTGTSAARLEENSTETRELYSMAASGHGSRLVEIAAIQEGYPLYGELVLRSGRTIDSRSANELLDPGAGGAKAWVSPELAIQMELKVGDTLTLGDERLTISDIVEKDTSTGWRGFSLAPRVYIGQAALERSALVRPGSTLSHQKYYRFESEPDLDSLVREINATLTDPGIRVTHHRRAGEQMARALSYLSDYLGLVALVGLFLAALGSAYLFQSYLSRRLREIATLISLGLPHRSAISLYVIQALILGTAGALIAIAASSALLPAVSKAVESELDFPLSLSGSATRWAVTAALALVASLAASALVCLPLSVRIRTLKPGTLFQESATPVLGWNRGAIVALLPVALAFYLLSVWQAHSLRVGSLFFGGIVLSSAALVAIAHFLLAFLGRWLSAQAAPRPGAEPVPIRHQIRVPLRYLSRNRLGAVSAFLAIGLGALLINLLPQLQRNIESEIASPEVSTLPSLFLFDIQDEQVEPLRKLLAEENVSILQMSPMVRARLESINGKPFEKPRDPDESMTREGEQEARSRNRSYNLTYRAGLTEAEEIIEGRAFRSGEEGADARALPEISVEYRFADRLGVKIGDRLGFDIQGVTIEGTIVNLRKIRWTSFQPNFFIQFQPGALEEAPKSHLATLQKLDPERRAKLQNRIVRELNNVSIIDVSSVIQRGLTTFEQMAFALKSMAVLSVLTGLIVLFSIANHQARTRAAEVQLLKVLGTRRADVTRMFWVEFGAIGLLGAALGAALSTALSYVISARIFDWAWNFSWWLPLGSIVGITALTLGTTQIAALRTLRKKPASLLAQS